MNHITRHAFLTPGHNCWSLWTADGTQNITNEGATHRALESLAYAIDKMAQDGWQVKTISIDAGTPSFVLLARDEEVGS